MKQRAKKVAGEKRKKREKAGSLNQILMTEPPGRSFLRLNPY